MFLEKRYHNNWGPVASFGPSSLDPSCPPWQNWQGALGSGTHWLKRKITREKDENPTNRPTALGMREVNWTLGYGSIPIDTIFSGMNIHLPAILGFTRYQGFDPSPLHHGRWYMGFRR